MSNPSNSKKIAFLTGAIFASGLGYYIYKSISKQEKYL